ncbi:MAG: hypothetical protein C0483_26125 [Pirellula sp.]|nr:hypothetical protein [Pirellula sp.]
MAETKQVVRKITPDKLADFDEHWWPVTLLLLVTAGCLIGSVYFHPNSDFTTQVWYRNAWVQIGGLGATALLLIVGVAALKGDAQRRLQLGIFLSLLFHASLLFGARHYFLSVVGAPATDPEWNLIDEVAVTLPDYHPAENESEASDELTKPAETSKPKEAKVEVTPQTPEKMKAEKKETEQPEPTRNPEPTPVELARVDPKTPQKNEVLPDESLVRRELERTVPTETVKQQELKAVEELKRSLTAQKVDVSRSDVTAEPIRRLDTSTPRSVNVVRPTTASDAPERRTMADQTAALDVAAELSRRLTPAAAEPVPITPPETTIVQPSQQMPLDAPLSPVQAPAQQSPAASSGVVSAILTPSIAMAPGSPAPPMLIRAEAPESSDSVSVTLPTNRPQRVSAGGAIAGLEAVNVEAPNAPTTIAPGAAGGSTPDASLATTTRGDQGSPQSSMATEVALPSPQGQGSGATIGSPSVGPMRRSDAAGDGSAGLAAATGVIGRPGRGRAVGPSLAANNQLTGGALTAVTGPAVQAGNATMGAATGNAPAVSGIGSSLGERTVMQSGEGIRPSAFGSMNGAGMAPSAGAGMLAGGGATTGVAGGNGLGSASGGGGATGTGSGSAALGTGNNSGGTAPGSAAVSRRELGELASAAPGSSADNPIGGPRTRMDASDRQRDRHGNLKGSVHDLIVDGQMIGEKVVIITFYVDEEINESPLIGALAAKGYVVERLNVPLPPAADFDRKLDGVRQLWLISSEVNRLPAEHLQVLLARWRAGRLALCLMADNEPFTAEATTVLNAIAPGTTISGDYLGEQKLHAGETQRPGFDARLPLFHNVETLFEGTTISHINSRYLTPVCYASNGLPLIGIYQQEGSSRLLVHCGFTSLYERFWDDAGVSRFAVNVAGWLSEADKKPAPVRIIPTPTR